MTAAWRAPEGSRTPWSGSGGSWILAVPLLVVAGLVVAFLRSPPPAPSATASITVFRPTFERLPPVPDGHYEVWVKRPEGGEELLAAFTVLTGGQLLTLSGEPVQTFPVGELPPVGSRLLLTVESGSAPAIMRSDRVLLQGTFSATDVTFEPTLPAAQGTSVALLLAPTDALTPDTGGLWFAKPASTKGKPGPGLALESPASGWRFGGFVTTAGGTVLPTGAFRDPAEPDDRAPFSGRGKGLAVPGEDFVANAPGGVSFPLSLADGRTAVTVSVLPDFAADAAEPFLPLLSARIPYRQKTREPFPLTPAPREELPSGRGVFEQQSS